MRIDVEGDTIRIEKSRRHLVLTGAPLLAFGICAVVTGISAIAGPAPYRAYGVVLLALGLPSLIVGAFRCAARAGIVLDVNGDRLITWSRGFGGSTRDEYRASDITAVLLTKYWRFGKQEQGFLYRVALELRGEPDQEIDVEERLTDRAGHESAALLADFLDVPMLERKGSAQT